MVGKRLLVGCLAIVFVSIILSSSAFAQTRQYHLNQEWMKIWIRDDGSIDLFYNISMTLESGLNINHVFVGQPNGDFTVNETEDQYGHSLSWADASSGSDYKVQVNLATPLSAGQTVWFTLFTNVVHMIYEDNETNVGMLFIPTWWSEATVLDLRVSIVVPKGVNSTSIGTSELYWDNLLVEPDGSYAVFWQRQNLAPNQQYKFGVTFPKGYTEFVKKQNGWDIFVQQYLSAVVIIGVVAVIIVVLIVSARRRAYLSPTISMETLGIRRGFTAVEASYLLDMKPPKIVTEILYSLLQKRAVWVESTKPSIKLKIMEPFENKTGTHETPLRYYEIDFLKALKEDGTLDEEKLAKTVMFLRDTVEEKLRGYQRRDTIDYYAKVVDKAWKQVEQAGTADLASKAYDEQLLWLFLDPNVQTRTQTVFQDRVFEPSPLWLWYWYGYQQYNPHPTYTPSVGIPTQAAKPPAIPGAEFANNIATAVEKTSNNIVVNLEKFANAIVPMPAGKASNQPAHHDADCVCACATCACACACVSCACACAGGGIGLKKGGLKP